MRMQGHQPTGLFLFVLVLGSLLCACPEVDLSRGRFVCSTVADCPSGWVCCANAECAAAASLCAVADAHVPPDAADSDTRVADVVSPERVVIDVATDAQNADMSIVDAGGDVSMRDANAGDVNFADTNSDDVSAFDAAATDTWHECESDQSRACNQVPEAFPCGTAHCVDGRWDRSTCSGQSEWCIDQDGDSYCAPNATCIMACSAPSDDAVENCSMTDCNDNNRDISPATPEDCTPADSCVTHAILYSASASACVCLATSTPTNEGTECGTWSKCENGRCVCQTAEVCYLGCGSGHVTCIVGPACVLDGNAPAGTPCGSGSYMCNGAGECWDNCAMGLPGCANGSCINGSMSFNCLQGTMCVVSYMTEGYSCEINGTCSADGVCVH